jgi:hypothetical protein
VIGGGVCLDVVGLAANLFRRNTPVIKVGRGRWQGDRETGMQSMNAASQLADGFIL